MTRGFGRTYYRDTPEEGKRRVAAGRVSPGVRPLARVGRARSVAAKKKDKSTASAWCMLAVVSMD